MQTSNTESSNKWSYNYISQVNYKKLENDKDCELCETTYRKQLLDAFNITVDEFDSINNKIDILYDIIHSCRLWDEDSRKEFDKIILKCASQFMSDDPKMGFMVLFSYDYFDMIHSFLFDMIENEFINNNLIEKLKNKILK